MSSSDDSFLARFSSRLNIRLSTPCMSSPDLGGMKVTRGSQCHSQFGRHTPRFMVVFFSAYFWKQTDMILQSHIKAKKYMTKLFPHFDDLVALCDAVIVT